MTAKVDFKKDCKDLYLPKTKPMLIDVPEMQFIMVDGAGDPNSEAYQQAPGCPRRIVKSTTYYSRQENRVAARILAN